MDSKASEADVILNRVNVALARSQKIINSWLPPKLQGDESTLGEGNDEEEEEDFKAMTEAGGLGSSAAYDDDDSPARTLQRRKAALDDKLLEQLMGKKAAQAHRKSREAGKSMSVGKHAAPKPLTSRAKQSREVESDDAEDAGRSAAFKSRRIQQRQEPPVAQSMAVDDVENGARANGRSGVGQTSDVGTDEERSVEIQQRPQAKPVSRTTTSYLDELLAQKAKRRKKKKKSKHDKNS